MRSLTEILKSTKTDSSSAGPREIVGLEEPTSLNFTDESTFTKFVNLIGTTASQFGCGAEMRFKELPGFTHHMSPLYPPPLMMRQVVIVPKEEQLIESFKAALKNISASASDSMKVKMIIGQSEDFVKLKELAGQLSRVLNHAARS